ncbi:MAG: hypothetical protein ACI4J6_02860 [Oscillospiraceae bacterium]
MENKIDVQENMEVETGGLEEIILKQSEQNRRKKSKLTKNSSSKKGKDKSK